MKKRKVLAIALSLLLALGTLFAAGCNDGKPSQQTPSFGITPASTVFVNGTSGDLVLGLNPADSKVTSVTEGGAAVDAGNYTVSDGNLTLKSDYLASLSVGKHTFTVTADGHSVSVDVRIYGAPEFSVEKTEYLWDEPQDLVVPLDLGGDSIVSIYVGTERLAAESFTAADGMLTVSKESIESTCIDGENTLTLNTSVGTATLIINCHAKVIHATFDANRYKIQTENGKDVSFGFNPGGADFTLSILNGNTYSQFDGNAYEYNALTKIISIKAAWLDEKYASVYSFRLNVADSDGTQIDFNVGAAGKAGSAKLAVPGSAYAMNGFDTLAVNDSFGGSNVTSDTFFTHPEGAENKIVSGAQAISGNSLSVTSKVSNVGWNTLFGMNMPFKQNVLYRFDMKMKMQTVAGFENPSLALRFMSNPEVWGLLVDYHADSDSFTISQKSDERTVFEYDSATKIINISLYMTPGASGENFTFTAINADKINIVIDDLRVLATDIPVALTTDIAPIEYMKLSGADVEIDLSATGVKLSGGVTLNGTALNQGTGYTVTEKGFAIKASAFASLADGDYTLAFEGYYVKDVFGATENVSCQTVITVNSVEPVRVTGSALKVQTAAKEALTYAVSSGSFTLNGVTENGAAVASENYEMSDGSFTLKAEYLNTLTVGLHRFALNFKYGEDRTMQVNLSAGVYGNDTAHLADVVGILDFNSYNIGQSLASIIPPKEGASSTDGYFHSWNGTANKTIIADGAMGKALKIPSGESGAGCLSFNTLKTNTVYVVRIKFRTENDAAIGSLLLKWVSAPIDASWVENNSIKNDTKDFRTTIEKDGDNVYTWTSYLPSVSSSDQLILWSVSPQELHIGSIEIIETSLSNANQAHTPYNYAQIAAEPKFVNNSTVAYSGSGDLDVIEHVNDEGEKFNEFWLEYNGVKLVKGTDYELNGYAVKLKESFLKTLPTGTATLTVCRGKTGVTDIYGELYAGSQTATLNVVIS